MDRKRPQSNDVHKLFSREIGGSRPLKRLKMQHVLFRNFKLQAEFDAFNEDPGRERLVYQALDRFDDKSRICTIIVARQLVFALTIKGGCAVFNRETKKRICFLNDRDEQIEYIFYIKKYDCILTISSQNRRSRWRVIALISIERGQPTAAFPDYYPEGECDIYFSSQNDKIISTSYEAKTCKVLDLSFKTLFSIQFVEQVCDIQAGPGMLFLILQRTASSIPLQLVSMEDGSFLKHINIKVAGGEDMDNVNVHLCCEKLLLMQGSYLQRNHIHIVNLRNEDLKCQTINTLHESAVLSQRQLILTSEGNRVQLWNLQGELVTCFMDRDMKPMHISENEDLLISYSKIGLVGSVSIHDLLTGDCVGKIRGDDPSIKKSQEIATTVTDALDDVDEVFYDEEKNEIYTCTIGGLVHVWSNLKALSGQTE